MLRRLILRARGICNQPTSHATADAVYNGWCTNWRWHSGPCQDDLDGSDAWLFEAGM
jgi:hypothetical protein